MQVNAEQCSHLVNEFIIAQGAELALLADVEGRLTVAPAEARP